MNTHTEMDENTDAGTARTCSRHGGRYNDETGLECSGCVFEYEGGAEEEARQDEMGAEMGDPRRCPRHPSVKTSSNDGMFDGLCEICEGEMSDEAEERRASEHDAELSTEQCRQGLQAWWIAPAARRPVTCMDATLIDDSDIPF